MNDIIQTLDHVAQTQKQIIAGNEKMIANNNQMLGTLQTALEQEKETQRLLNEAFAVLGL